jgi:hypothetical protein
MNGRKCAALVSGISERGKKFEKKIQKVHYIPDHRLAFSGDDGSYDHDICRVPAGQRIHSAENHTRLSPEFCE